MFVILMVFNKFSYWDNVMKLNEIVINSRGSTNKIIFVFHGYGANKEDLIPIAENFSDNIEDAEIHLADGIQECYDGFGFQWFSLSENDLDAWKNEYYKIEETLESYINDTINKKGLTYKDVALTGFSQGGMISLMLGLKLKVSAVISFSGLLIDSNIDINQNHTKILMTHGKLDTVVPIYAMHYAENYLKNHGLDIQTIVSEKTMHGIDDKMLKGAVNFLQSLTI